jgi:E3 ubiquitin-protein ligase RNF13
LFYLIKFNKKNVSIGSYDDLIARFGPRLPIDGLKGWINVAKPLNGCSEIDKPPSNVSGIHNWIALIQRSPPNTNCSFDSKVFNAQNAGYSAAIIFNINSNYLVKMSSSGEHNVYIPSVFIGESDGLEIINNFTYTQGYHVLLIEDEYNISIYLIPFCVVVATCFLIMMSVFAIKFIIYYRKSRKNRLSRSALKKIPTKKYQKTDKYDTCPICLDEYEEGVKIRILPCEHVYHIKCIDEWLLKNNRFCPVCKRRVLPGDEESADEEEDNQNSSRIPIQSNENATVIISSSIDAIGQSNEQITNTEDETSRLISTNQQQSLEQQNQSPTHHSLTSSPTHSGTYGSIVNSNSLDLNLNKSFRVPNRKNLQAKSPSNEQQSIIDNIEHESRLQGESFRSCINDEDDNDGDGVDDDELIESIDEYNHDDKTNLLPTMSNKTKKERSFFK